jgi:predicted transcriptional regulator
MKAILISVNPEPAYNIMTGRKKIEVRKSMPRCERCELPIDVYMYCTKGGETLYVRAYNGALRLDKTKWCTGVRRLRSREGLKASKNAVLNGTVCAKFTLNRVDTIECDSHAHNHYAPLACLTPEALGDYCDGCDLYGWHISDLAVFDELKTLSDFGLTRPPQSWQYVEVVDNG